MATYTLNLRDNKTEGTTSVLLYIRWSSNSESIQLKINTGVKVKPSNWQNDSSLKHYKKIIPINVGDNGSYNTKLSAFELRTEKLFNRFEIDNDRTPTKEEFQNLLNPETQKQSITLFDYFEQYIKDASKRFNTRTQKFISEGTIKTYKNTLVVMRHHEKWAQNQKGANKVLTDFSTINMEWYYSFLDWCLDERGYQLNNIGKYIKTIIAMLNDAKARGYNPYNHYMNKKFMGMSEEVENIYLTEDELEKMSEADFPIGSALDNARDLFLIGCWTGLRASDFLGVNKEDLEGDFLHVTTKKTGHKVVIPINDIIRSIHTKHQEKGLPEMTPQKVNQYIKIAGMRVLILHVDIQVKRNYKRKVTVENVKKYNLICTHTARRSFSTNMYKMGVSTKDIMAITGHRTEQQFFKYIKITPQESAERMLQVMEANKVLRASQKKEREEKEEKEKQEALNKKTNLKAI